MREGFSAFWRLQLLLVTALFFTTSSGSVITPNHIPTKTPYVAAYRTQYGAHHPQRTMYHRPRNPAHDLQAREVVTWTIETCGWTSMNANKPKTCPVGLGCGWDLGGSNSSLYGVVCFPYDDRGEINWGDAVLPTTCLSYGQANITASQAYSETHSETLLCGRSAQQCATAVFEGGPLLSGLSTSFELQIFTSMFCANSSTQVHIYQTTTNSISSSDPPTVTTPSSSSSSFPSTSANPDKEQNKVKVTHSPTPTPSKSSSSNTGTIAGATAGAVVGIALIAAAAGYYIWRRSDKKNHTPLEISSTSSSAGMGTYSRWQAIPRYQPLQHGDTAYQQVQQADTAYLPVQQGDQAYLPVQQTAYAPVHQFGHSPRSELGHARSFSQGSGEAGERLWSG